MADAETGEDRSMQRREARKRHQVSAENQYPAWNKHTAAQLKLLQTQHGKKNYK